MLWLGSIMEKTSFLPREHGATAMLLVPILCAAVLARQWRWAEVATMVAATAALAAKDPLVVLARQRFVWKLRRPETDLAKKYLAAWVTVAILCGIVMLASWPLPAVVVLGAGVCAFSALAVAINVKNRQRSTVFQILSAAALTSGTLAICLSATGSIEGWCWWLWPLMAIQAAAGILVVHARLDARVSARANRPVDTGHRRAAYGAVAALACAALCAVGLNQGWIALALSVALAGYGFDLWRQRDPAEMKVPLTRIGQQGLALSFVYAVLIVIGLW